MYQLSHFHKNTYLHISFDELNIHIEDSYQVKTKKEMEAILWIVEGASFNRGISYARKRASWIREWKAHNLLYKLGLFKSRTKSVDLNENESWFKRLGYFILSIFY
mgnify:CR=1 FL=1